MDAKKVFKSVYMEPNFMTPKVMEYGQRGRFVYELSRGDFMGRDLFGVTVVDSITWKEAEGLAHCFRDIEKAKGYIDSLAEKGE